MVSAVHDELAVRRTTDTLMAAPVRTCHQQDVELAHSVVIATDFILGSPRQVLTLDRVSFNKSHSAVRLFYPSSLLLTWPRGMSSIPHIIALMSRAYMNE